ncbi:stress responsive A/B barrel domain protein [Hyaloscypha bicolor E]|uniref:Stress responsive A/B barrel domain protein n=1 Tax=Hyaloscypha bicolor E TaxID=1095630 RepID=A0A2J6TDY2_9HELO|nr:stress responsive A/B barrel domain protein [Hyaloscypha bicolor E]PMD61212.1 stress responsive A/B barrel domain protein [Hyaloscypha bicolor E]
MTTPITRVTMVKIPEDKIDIALQGFEVFVKNQQKDGKPYILSMQAGRTSAHVKIDQGYTLVGKTVFKSMEDVEYYIDGCEAHQAFKVYLKENATPEGLMSICFTPEVSWEMEKAS